MIQGPMITSADWDRRPGWRPEWLETDAYGGYASGPVRGPRTRRYHALLLTAMRPPGERVVLVNGFEAWVETAAGRTALTTQAYMPDVEDPDGARRLAGFQAEPWPRWRFRLENGSEVEHDLLVAREAAETWLRWRLVGSTEGVRLVVRPLLSGRDYHALHRENGAFRFEAEQDGEGSVRWQPYGSLPAIEGWSNADYAHDPVWYRSFRYDEERRRGLDFIEDLGSPGTFTWHFDQGDAVLRLRAVPGPAPDVGADDDGTPLARADAVFAAERASREVVPAGPARAGRHYVVRRGTGLTILAGFPWFTDWGRDTFVAMRGLCLATGRLDVARDILLAWSGSVSDGMLPNRFADAGDVPEYNTVDGSLWFAVAVREYLAAAARAGAASDEVSDRLHAAVGAIVAGYRRGTRYGIRLDPDGLVAAGEPGSQLTWMDAKIGDHVVTPRIGKPVEVQALWLNALRFAALRDPELEPLIAQGLASFRSRFWNPDEGCLYDVVDVDGVAGRLDAAFRPNQIFAVGGLPDALLDGEPARQVVETVEFRLLTPTGLRSLAPGSPGYRARYEGNPYERDTAYHQGTVWPWLLGPFVEAWLRVRGSDPETRTEARTRFLAPWRDLTMVAGLGHIPEVFDAGPPQGPGGCPFQAWSLGELIRIEVLLAEEAPPP